MDFNMLLPKITNLATLLVSYKRDSFDVDIKSDGSPVTSADLYFNELLETHLPRVSNIPIVSEENEKVNFKKRQAWENFWLIDPIDGTKGFIEGSKEWTVNVALIQRNKVVMGLIVAPELDQAWLGMVGKGVYKYEKNSWIELKSIQFRAKSKARILGSIHHPEKQLEEFLNQNSGSKLLSVGSSLKFCWIAENKADYYPRYNCLNEWDIAAGHGIVKAAGGNVYLMNSLDEHLYNSEDLKSKPFEVY